MKKTIVSLIVYFTTFGISNAISAQMDKSNLELGAEISHIKYEEPGIMESKGIMYGISASYVNRGDLTFKVEGRVAGGEVDYEGSGKINDVDDFIFEFRFMGGKDYPLSGGGSITPYIGFGYRYLNDDMSGRTSSVGNITYVGYERESTYYYIPIGMEILSQQRSNWTIGAMLEYDYFWDGEQKSHLSDTGLGYNDVENDQDDGYVLRGSVKFLKESGAGRLIKIEPFVRYWKIKRSDLVIVTKYGTPVEIGYEPKNKSTEIGINLSLTF